MRLRFAILDGINHVSTSPTHMHVPGTGIHDSEWRPPEFNRAMQQGNSQVHPQTIALPMYACGAAKTQSAATVAANT